MSEEISVSQNEIDAATNEVNARLAQEAESKNQSLAKKIREEVKTEFERKAEITKLQEELSKQNEAMKKANEEAIKARAEADEKVKQLESTFRKELEDITAVRKGIVADTGNPFQAQNTNSALTRNVGGKTIDVSNPKLMDEIEEQSRLALMQAWGIDPNTHPEWGRDPRKR